MRHSNSQSLDEKEKKNVDWIEEKNSFIDLQNRNKMYHSSQ
jgi:hypothetical protein